MKSRTGSEFEQDNEIYAQHTHVVTFWNDSITRTIKTNDRLQVNGNIYNIVAAPDNGFVDRQDIRLMCLQND